MSDNKLNINLVAVVRTNKILSNYYFTGFDKCIDSKSKNTKKY